MMKKYLLFTLLSASLLLAACATAVTPASLAPTQLPTARTKAASMEEVPAITIEATLVDTSIIPVEA